MSKKKKINGNLNYKKKRIYLKAVFIFYLALELWARQISRIRCNKLLPKKNIKKEKNDKYRKWRKLRKHVENLKKYQTKLNKLKIWIYENEAKLVI